MFPFLIDYQIRWALQEYAEKVALPDTVKKELMERILKKLDVKLAQEKTLSPKGSMLSIQLATVLVGKIIVSECSEGRFLTVQQELEDEQIEFKIDTFRRVNITFS